MHSRTRHPERSGEVRVVLSEIGATRGVLLVEDDGVGKSDETIKGTGLGTKIVRALAGSLNATVTYQSRQPGDGGCCRFRRPDPIKS